MFQCFIKNMYFLTLRSMFDPKTLKVSRRRHLETLVHEVGNFFRKFAVPKIKRLFRIFKKKLSPQKDTARNSSSTNAIIPCLWRLHVVQRLKKKTNVFFFFFRLISKNHWATWRAFVLPAPSIVLWFPYIATIKSNLPHGWPSRPHKVPQWKQCHWPIV